MKPSDSHACGRWAGTSRCLTLEPLSFLTPFQWRLAGLVWCCGCYRCALLYLSFSFSFHHCDLDLREVLASTQHSWGRAGHLQAQCVPRVLMRVQGPQQILKTPLYLLLQGNFLSESGFSQKYWPRPGDATSLKGQDTRCLVRCVSDKPTVSIGFCGLHWATLENLLFGMLLATNVRPHRSGAV